MKRKIFHAALTVICAGGLITGIVLAQQRPPAPPPPPASAQAGTAALMSFSDAFANVAGKVKPSVVTVFSEKTVKMPRFQWPFGGGSGDQSSPFQYFFGDEDTPRPRQPQRDYKFKKTGMGSGVVLDKEGHILTNNHVVDNTDEIKVKFPDGGTFDAEIVGTDSRSDIAVLKLKGKVPKDLIPAVIGDSETLRVGDWVMAVGAPFGYEQTVTVGIISAKGRTQVDDDRDKYQDFLQTDAAINPGNSGGPLVNLHGEVIGINTAIATSVGQFAGVGFAIPINMVKHIMRDLLKNGHVTRGYLGVMIQDLSPELAEQFKMDNGKGSIVTQLGKDSPAGKSGIKIGDVIVKFNGKEITNTRQLRNTVADTDPNSKVDLIVIRDGKEKTINVTLGSLPDEDKTASRRGANGDPENKSTDFGLSVEPLTGDKARQLGIDNDSGVLVTSVDNDSPADAAHVQPGDLIVEVNRVRVTNPDEFHAEISKSKTKAMLLVKNKDGTRFAVLTAK